MQRLLILFWISTVVHFVLFRQGWACHCQICSLTNWLTNKIRQIFLNNVQVIFVARMANFQDMNKAASQGFDVEFKTSRIKDIIKLFFSDEVSLTLKTASDSIFLQFIFQLWSNYQLHFFFLFVCEGVQFTFNSFSQSSNYSFRYRCHRLVNDPVIWVNTKVTGDTWCLNHIPCENECSVFHHTELIYHAFHDLSDRQFILRAVLISK